MVVPGTLADLIQVYFMTPLWLHRLCGVKWSEEQGIKKANLCGKERRWLILRFAWRDRHINAESSGKWAELHTGI